MLLKRIAHFGVTESQSAQTRRGIIITNYLSVILLALAFFLLSYRNMVFHNTAQNITIVVAVPILLLPIVANFLGLAPLGQLLVSYLPVAVFWGAFYNIMNKTTHPPITLYDGLRFYLLASSIIPLLTLYGNDLWLKLLGVLPTFISIVFFDKIMTFLGLSAAIANTGNEDYVFQSLRTGIAYLIITSGCVVLQEIIRRSEEQNQKLVDTLQQKSKELEISNTLLAEHKTKLEFLNADLEVIARQKTASLRRKNEALIRYSFANAHSVRGPIARILGLLELQRISPTMDQHFLFEKIRSEAKDADRITREISLDLTELELQE